MIVYKQPVVTVISYPTFVEPAHLPCKWKGESTNAERLIEYSGRICYMSQGNPAERTTAEYVTNILEQAHGSVTEHANISLLLEGVSRSLTHELVRHRAGFAYSQLSQRYVDSSDCAVVMPPRIQELGNVEQGKWIESMLEALEEYESLVNLLMQHDTSDLDKTSKRKAAREAARSVLPNAVETKIVVTANIRAWRHFLEMRGALGADAEIRKLAIAVLDALYPVAPSGFADYQIEKDPNGRLYIASNKYRKV